MDKYQAKFGRSNILRAILYSLFIVIPIYGLLVAAYYFDYLM